MSYQQFAAYSSSSSQPAQEPYCPPPPAPQDTPQIEGLPLSPEDKDRLDRMPILYSLPLSYPLSVQARQLCEPGIRVQRKYIHEQQFGKHNHPKQPIRNTLMRGLDLVNLHAKLSKPSLRNAVFVVNAEDIIYYEDGKSDFVELFSFRSLSFLVRRAAPDRTQSKLQISAADICRIIMSIMESKCVSTQNHYKWLEPVDGACQAVYRVDSQGRFVLRTRKDYIEWTFSRISQESLLLDLQNFIAKENGMLHA